ncbi:MAG: DUF805 domain-containing protein [Mesosutterella sp.]|nr:DUF805 domain-containing protein [Mesosutterella sp.]
MTREKTLWELYKSGLTKYFDFRSRSTRKEFWVFVLATQMTVVILTAIDPLLGTVAAILAFVPTISVTARRLHDRGYSGWWIALPYGLIFVGTALLSTEDEQTYRTASTILEAAGLLALIWIWVQSFMRSFPHENPWGPVPDNLKRSAGPAPDDLKNLRGAPLEGHGPDSNLRPPKP